MKRILILGDINSPHIQKWVTSLVNNEFFIGVFSLSASKTTWHQALINFKLFDTAAFDQSDFYQSTFQKITFLKVMPSLKKAIQSFKPDIVHAHYASSYGLIGALSKFHPYIISVWGSDVFDFPKQNFINKKVLKYNLSKADFVLSTSEAMKHETELYTDKRILLTPFGIDLEKFKPIPLPQSNRIVIGTIKRLDEAYGIIYLIKAFEILAKKYAELDFQLLLVGDGAQTEEYKKLVTDLGIADQVIFTGLVPHEQIVAYHNKLDVFVAVSLRESFGVAVLEASACEKPVVVSNVGGLPEVVKDGETGYIVPAKDELATAAAIEKLILDKNLRLKLGVNGRKFVKENYDWNLCVEKMIKVYNSEIQ